MGKSKRAKTAKTFRCFACKRDLPFREVRASDKTKKGFKWFLCRECRTSYVAEKDMIRNKSLIESYSPTGTHPIKPSEEKDESSRSLRSLRRSLVT